MNHSSTLFCSIGIFFLVGINPAVCTKAFKGCKSTAGDVGRQAGKQASHTGGKAGKELGEAVIHTDPPPLQEIRTAEDAKRSKSYSKNSESSYHYNNQEYTRFQDIPFHTTDQLLFDHAPTASEAQHLIKRGVKFIYNSSAYTHQKDSRYRIVYLIAGDVPSVKTLYDVDDLNAKRLLFFSANLINNEKIIKVSSLQEMFAKQNEILGENEIPVLVFHNNIESSLIGNFNKASNIITCNSFEVNPEAYLTSLDLLDLRAIVEAVNSSYHTQTLGEFYDSFTSSYYTHMNSYHQQNTLIYLGGGLVVGGGVYAIAYYNKKP